jgi:flagellar biosynthetic protein FlhB
VADEGEKPFDPTPSKINKARREGNVPRSQELNTVAVFLVTGAVVLMIMPSLGATMREWIVRVSADPMDRWTHDPNFYLTFAAQILWLVLAPLGAAIATGFIITMIQSGGLLITPLKVKPDKLKPSDGFKRMFGGEAAVGALRGTLAFAVAIAALVPTFRELFARVSQDQDALSFAQLAVSSAIRVAIVALAIAAVFSIADVIITRRRWRKKLRMDWYELKRDSIETEGNPYVKARRKAIHRSLIRGPVASVQNANFVVANPTHIAIALEYHYPEVPVPVVLVMATDEKARRVKALAFQYAIPVIENRPLARALLETANVGRTIPKETFVAVAEIVAALGRQGATAS